MRIATLALSALGALAACRAVSLPAVQQPGVAAPRVEAPRAGRGNLAGAVADSVTGYSVVGAEIYFTRDSVVGSGPARPRADLPRTRTDRSGGFAFRDLAPGEYTLAFSSLDHVPLRVVVVVREGQTHTVTLRPRRRL